MKCVFALNKKDNEWPKEFCSRKEKKQRGDHISDCFLGALGEILA
jgi:hypothetical protein